MPESPKLDLSTQGSPEIGPLSRQQTPEISRSDSNHIKEKKYVDKLIYISYDFEAIWGMNGLTASENGLQLATIFQVNSYNV